uniref:aminocyclopropanecarboxylate oxidase n=1 Tax=Wollemia nobilis TaxID=56998 RepID=A0A0C9S6K6_9CONI
MVVPVIDIENIDGEGREIIMAKIDQACKSPGFFQLVNHGIQHSRMDRVKKVCSQHYKLNREKLFNESLPVKELNNALVAEANGNTPKIESMDWEDVFQVHEMQEANSWPSKPDDFKETIQEFRKEIYALTEKLLEIISLNLGLEKDYVKRAFSGGKGGEEKPFFGTKISHYPPCPRPDLINGIRAHTDAGGLILLFQDDEVPGLEVLNDGKWIDVQPLRYAIVVNTGDQLEAISNGKYKSAWHRIIPNKNGNRLSLASFYNPSYNAMIYPAPELSKDTNADGDELSVYPKYLCGDYMRVYTKQKYEDKKPRFKAMRSLKEQIPC